MTRIPRVGGRAAQICANLPTSSSSIRTREHDRPVWLTGLRDTLRGLKRQPGFTAAAVKRMFVLYGLAVATIGIAAGLAAAAALSRFLAAQLFEVRPLDPATYVMVLGVLLTAVWLAAYLPARRAARLDPAETLRAE